MAVRRRRAPGVRNRADSVDADTLPRISPPVRRLLVDRVQCGACPPPLHSVRRARRLARYPRGWFAGLPAGVRAGLQAQIEGTYSEPERYRLGWARRNVD